MNGGDEDCTDWMVAAAAAAAAAAERERFELRRYRTSDVAVCRCPTDKTRHLRCAAHLVVSGIPSNARGSLFALNLLSVTTFENPTRPAPFLGVLDGSFLVSSTAHALTPAEKRGVFVGL